MESPIGSVFSVLVFLSLWSIVALARSRTGNLLMKHCWSPMFQSDATNPDVSPPHSHLYKMWPAILVTPASLLDDHVGSHVCTWKNSKSKAKGPSLNIRTWKK